MGTATCMFSCNAAFTTAGSSLLPCGFSTGKLSPESPLWAPLSVVGERKVPVGPFFPNCTLKFVKYDEFVFYWRLALNTPKPHGIFRRICGEGWCLGRIPVAKLGTVAHHSYALAEAGFGLVHKSQGCSHDLEAVPAKMELVDGATCEAKRLEPKWLRNMMNIHKHALLYMKYKYNLLYVDSYR